MTFLPSIFRRNHLIPISFAASLAMGSLLLIAAFFDDSLWLPGNATGLLEHPGMLSIVVGDLLLALLSGECLAMSSRIGAKLQTSERNFMKRYFRIFVWNNIFKGQRIFFRVFIFCSFIGLLGVVNQTIKLFDPITNYGHDTFDSIDHIYSFAANRINLTISWCVSLPMFAASIISHAFALNRHLAASDRRKNLKFCIHHPDKCGGFSFFGTLNTLYLFGLVITFSEAILLIYTHNRISVSNIASLALAAAGVTLISYFSIYPLNKAISRLESALRSHYYYASRNKKAMDDIYFYIVSYKLNFSAYNKVSGRLTVALRMITFVPAAYRTVDFLRTSF